jgi:hypothetical protein
MRSLSHDESNTVRDTEISAGTVLCGYPHGLLVGHGIGTLSTFTLHPAPQHVRQSHLARVHTRERKEGLVEEIAGRADQWLRWAFFGYFMLWALVPDHPPAFFLILPRVLE